MTLRTYGAVALLGLCACAHERTKPPPETGAPAPTCASLALVASPGTLRTDVNGVIGEADQVADALCGSRTDPSRCLRATYHCVGERESASDLLVFYVQDADGRWMVLYAHAHPRMDPLGGSI